MKLQPENQKYFILDLLNYGSPSPPPESSTMLTEPGDIMITEGVEMMITEGL